MPEPPSKLLLPLDASAYLRERGVSRSVKTLAKLRCVGGGPLYHRIGRNIGYTPGDLDAYAARQISAPYASTAQYQAARLHLDTSGHRDHD
jgi:hypothetical protein